MTVISHHRFLIVRVEANGARRVLASAPNQPTAYEAVKVLYAVSQPRGQSYTVEPKPNVVSMRR